MNRILNDLTRRKKLVVSKIMGWSLTVCLFITACGSVRKMTLTDISTQYSDYQATELDPFVGHDWPMEQYGMSDYDDFFNGAHKLSMVIRFAKNTVQSYNDKKAKGQDNSLEARALASLGVSLPELTAGVVELIQKGITLTPRVKQDFSGVKMTKVPKVLKMLSDTKNELGTIKTEAPQLIADIKTLSGK